MNKKKVSAIILTLLTLLILTVSVPPARAQFVLSSWAFPDEYGQGIIGFAIYENSTGAWEHILDIEDGWYSHSETQVLKININGSIKLRCYSLFNSTLTGAGTSAEGKNYQRHNVTVFDITDTLIFSQQNFTYVSVDIVNYLPLWCYVYEVILNFIPEYSQYYTVTVIYEVFW